MDLAVEAFVPPVLRPGDLGMRHETLFRDLIDQDSFGERRLRANPLRARCGGSGRLRLPATLDETVERGCAP